VLYRCAPIPVRFVTRVGSRCNNAHYAVVSRSEMPRARVQTTMAFLCARSVARESLCSDETKCINIMTCTKHNNTTVNARRYRHANGKLYDLFERTTASLTTRDSSSCGCVYSTQFVSVGLGPETVPSQLKSPRVHSLPRGLANSTGSIRRSRKPNTRIWRTSRRWPALDF